MDDPGIKIGAVFSLSTLFGSDGAQADRMGIGETDLADASGRKEELERRNESPTSDHNKDNHNSVWERGGDVNFPAATVKVEPGTEETNTGDLVSGYRSCDDIIPEDIAHNTQYGDLTNGGDPFVKRHQPIDISRVGLGDGNDSYANSDPDIDDYCALDVDEASDMDMAIDDLDAMDGGEDLFTNMSFSESTDSALSSDNAIGSPPVLPMENLGLLSSVFHDDLIERMPPPVLSPVSQTTDQKFYKIEPIDDGYGGIRVAKGPGEVPKKGSKRIDPCYLVLTDISPYIEADRCSYGRMKNQKPRIECSNMCKKMYFRRRLKAGRNVFNVKTVPVSEFREITLNDTKQRRKTNINPHSSPLPKKRLRKEASESQVDDAETTVESSLVNLDMFTKVKTKKCRYLPDDFDQLKAENEALKRVQRKTEERERVEKEKQEELLRKRIRREFKLNMFKLREQVRLKRAKNKAWKQLNKAQNMRHEKEPFVSSSGRVRKVNTMYDSFAVTSEEIKTLRAIQRVESTERRIKKALKEKDKKHMGEKLKMDADKARRLKFNTEQSIKEKREAMKKIEIDNPEVDNTVDCSKSVSEMNDLKIRSQENPKDPETGLCIDPVNMKRREQYAQVKVSGSCRNIFPRIRKMKRDKKKNKILSKDNIPKKKSSNKRKNFCSKDTVLIQNLPSDKNVIDYLQPIKTEPYDIEYDSSASKSTEGYDHMNMPPLDTSDEGSYAYGFAKSILKNSLTDKKRRRPIMSPTGHAMTGARATSPEQTTQIIKSRNVLKSLLNATASPVAKTNYSSVKSKSKNETENMKLPGPGSVVHAVLPNEKTLIFRIATEKGSKMHPVFESNKNINAVYSNSDSKVVHNVLTSTPSFSSLPTLLESKPVSNQNVVFTNKSPEMMPTKTVSGITVFRSKPVETQSSIAATKCSSSSLEPSPSSGTQYAVLSANCTPSNTNSYSGSAMCSVVPITNAAKPAVATISPSFTPGRNSFIVLESNQMTPLLVPVSQSSTTSIASVPPASVDVSRPITASVTPIAKKQTPVIKLDCTKFNLKPTVTTSTAVISTTREAPLMSLAPAPPLVAGQRMLAKQITPQIAQPNKPTQEQNRNKSPIATAQLVGNRIPTNTKSPFFILPSTMSSTIKPAVTSSKKFYLLTVDGKSILVPVQEDVSKPTAYLAKDSPQQITPSTAVPDSKSQRSAVLVNTIGDIPTTTVTSVITAPVSQKTTPISTTSLKSIPGTMLTSAAAMLANQIAVDSCSTPKLPSSRKMKSIISNVSTESQPQVGVVNNLKRPHVDKLIVLKPTEQSVKTTSGQTENCDRTSELAKLKTCVVSSADATDVKMKQTRGVTSKSENTTSNPKNLIHVSGFQPDALITKIMVNPTTNENVQVAGQQGISKDIKIIQMVPMSSSQLFSGRAVGQVPLLSNYNVDATGAQMKSPEASRSMDGVEIVSGTSGHGIRRPSDNAKSKADAAVRAGNILEDNSSLTNVLPAGSDNKSKSTFDKLGKTDMPAEDDAASKEPRPFSEVTSDREERLRKLKELLREKQQAVDDLRRNRDNK